MIINLEIVNSKNFIKKEHNVTLSGNYTSISDVLKKAIHPVLMSNLKMRDRSR